MRIRFLMALAKLLGINISFNLVKPIFEKNSYVDAIGFTRTDEIITIPLNRFLGASIETFCHRQIASITMADGRRYFILWR